MRILLLGGLQCFFNTKNYPRSAQGKKGKFCSFSRLNKTEAFDSKHGKVSLFYFIIIFLSSQLGCYEKSIIFLCYLTSRIFALEYYFFFDIIPKNSLL